MSQRKRTKKSFSNVERNMSSSPSSNEEKRTDVNALEIKCDVGVPNVPKEKEIIDTKANRKRKASSNSSEGFKGNSKIKDLSIETNVPPTKKSKKDQIVDDFVLKMLPALRKEVKIRKKTKSAFNVRDFPQYFKTGSAEWLPTYSLSLFYFLGKNEIVCSQFGVFDGNKHMVKSIEGFNHVSLLISSLGEDIVNADEANLLMRRYGREWFKIPPKDYAKVMTAYRYGDNHQFKVILTGIFEDSFYDKDGKEVKTANPFYRYESVRVPPQKVKKEKLEQEKPVIVSSSSFKNDLVAKETNEEEEEDDDDRIIDLVSKDEDNEDFL
jgi:hypothetical protein